MESLDDKGPKTHETSSPGASFFQNMPQAFLLVAVSLLGLPDGTAL